MKLGLACLLSAGLAISAQAAQLGFNFTTDLGGNLVDNFDLVLPGFGLGPGSHLELDPGMRLDFGFGYTFVANSTIALSAGAEIGFLYNPMNNGVNPAGVKTPIDGDLWQTPFLGKVVLRFMPDAKLVPFIGGGGGGVYTATEFHRIGGTPVFFTGEETDPAVEGIAGVKYQLNDKMAVGVAYKALIVFPDGFDDVINHSFVAAFTLNF